MENSDATSSQTHSPTLARLSFWVPPEQMSEFEAVYEKKVIPVLKRHGLVVSPERGRENPEGVFSRLVEVKAPSEVAGVQASLDGDPAWQELLGSLGAAFGTTGSDDLIQHCIELYAAPAGPGKQVPAGRGKGHWRTYDGEDGLADNWVWSILQDKEGYLWFGTENGATRYDGSAFTTFTTQDGLADNKVRSIIQDREGHLWFGTDGGASRYDGQTWTTFTTEDGLAHNYVSSIMQDRESHFWFGTHEGVSRYDGQTWTTFTTEDGLARNRVLSIMQDRDGILWFGTWDGGVTRYDGQTWTIFTTEDGLAGNGVRSIIQDQDGYLWAACGGFAPGSGGVSRYDGQTWSVFEGDESLIHSPVSWIFQDWDGTLWIGTRSKGVSRYDGQSFTHFTTEDGLAGNWVISILQDREGHLWFGTGGSGVNRYDGLALVAYGVGDGLAHPEVRSILQDQEDNLWFGSYGGGVSRYDGKAFTTYTEEDGVPLNMVRCVLQDRERNLWVGTGGSGVGRYDGHTWSNFGSGDGLREGMTFSVFQDGDGHLWVGTQGGGVSRYDGQTWTTFTTQDGLGHDDVRSIFQDREGRLWFGTFGGGASRYDGRTWTTFTTEDGLANNQVRPIFEDPEGHFWFGTSGGVSRYDGRTWTTFTTEDGLAHNVVTSLWHDRKGHFWFGTWGGVSQYDGRVFQRLTRLDGLPSNAVQSVFQDLDGRIWIGTNNGLVRFCPPAPYPPPAFLDAVVADRRYGGVEALTVPALGGLTAFEFHGRSFKTRPEAMVYRYRLKGYDEDWHNTSARRVEYQDLPIGAYTFEVIAVDRDLVYSKEPATVRLSVVRDPRDEQIDELERRVRERTRELQEANSALSEANRDLYRLNQELQASNKRLDRERAVERVRAEVTAMESANDLPVVVEDMLNELSEAGVDFDLCVINIVDGEASVRRQYGATKQGWSGQAEMPLSEVSETFMAIYRGERPVVREADDVVTAACLQTREQLGITEALERPTAVVDAPFAYGTLSLQTHNPGGFSEEDVAFVGEFGRVVALGYARFLDFQRLEEQNRKLDESNAAMSAANRELFQANQALQRDRAVERIRGQVQAMEQVSDFEEVLSLLSEDLKTVGLSFETCGIDVLDEPVDEPTMAYFEEHGFQYTAYTIDPEGVVSRESYHIPAPFPPVNREMIERFIAGEPWKALIGGTDTILEVPASNYGRLRITSSDRQDFAEEDTSALQEFAAAIALGYTRYLDIREIQEQTERKSAFLASMSHELRTPMTAIKGFTNLVLRRRSENLTDRQRDNLTNVIQASDHLLAMINDLLDLSKIEAGRMDVNPEPFDVKALVATCCATVSPLLAEKPDVVLDYDVPDDIGEAHTDQARVRQMVINLLSNAVKFTDSGRVTVQAGREDDQLVITVSDTGKGIPPDEIDTIFDEYRQVKGSGSEHKGTGLGLSITKKFAELLGGTIRVESEVEKGSTFTARIPMAYSET